MTKLVLHPKWLRALFKFNEFLSSWRTTNFSQLFNSVTSSQLRHFLAGRNHVMHAKSASCIFISTQWLCIKCRSLATINAAPHTYNLQCGGGAFVLHVVVFNHGGGSTRATASERSSWVVCSTSQSSLGDIITRCAHSASSSFNAPRSGEIRMQIVIDKRCRRAYSSLCVQHNFQLTNMSQLGARNLCYNIARALSRDARMQIAGKQFADLARVAPILSNLRIDALGGGMDGRWYLQNSDRHADIPRIQFKLKVPLISWKR